MSLKKTTVHSVEVKPAKINNTFTQRYEIVDTIKILVYLQALLGINRIYLIKSGKFVRWFTKIYSCVLTLVILAHLITHKNEGTSNIVIQYATCFEFILLVTNSMVFQKKTFQYLLENMNMFDDILNINKDMSILNPSARGPIWMCASLMYSVIECVALFIYFGSWDGMVIYVMVLYTISILAHDSELILFCVMIRMILVRVCIMKAHVKKKFGETVDKASNEVDKQSVNIQLDTLLMHRTYELLHKCAEQFNSIMSLPMMILLFCSGVITTMLLKNVFTTVQTDQIDETLKLIIILFCIIRCARYTLMVIVPCYFSTVTTTQVTQIRTMLHDAANSGQLEKIEKRQVKAFFHLTREKEFAYAIWGVIRLNMSLPLSYSSLCTTYLVIIIQFSKFID